MRLYWTKIKLKQWWCGLICGHEFDKEIYISTGLIASECIHCGKYVCIGERNQKC